MEIEDILTEHVDAFNKADKNYQDLQYFFLRKHGKSEMWITNMLQKHKTKVSTVKRTED